MYNRKISLIDILLIILILFMLLGSKITPPCSSSTVGQYEYKVCSINLDDLQEFLNQENIHGWEPVDFEIYKNVVIYYEVILKRKRYMGE